MKFDLYKIVPQNISKYYIHIIIILLLAIILYYIINGKNIQEKFSSVSKSFGKKKY